MRAVRSALKRARGLVAPRQGAWGRAHTALAFCTIAGCALLATTLAAAGSTGLVAGGAQGPVLTAAHLRLTITTTTVEEEGGGGSGGGADPLPTTTSTTTTSSRVVLDRGEGAAQATVELLRSGEGGDEPPPAALVEEGEWEAGPAAPAPPAFDPRAAAAVLARQLSAGAQLGAARARRARWYDLPSPLDATDADRAACGEEGLEDEVGEVLGARAAEPRGTFTGEAWSGGWRWRGCVRGSRGTRTDTHMHTQTSTHARALSPPHAPDSCCACLPAPCLCLPAVHPLTLEDLGLARQLRFCWGREHHERGVYYVSVWGVGGWIGGVKGGG